MEKILDRIIEAYSMYSPDKEEEIKQRYMSLLFRNNGIYPFISNGILFNASIEGIEDNGQLILKREDGTIQRFAFKEISFVI